MFRYDVTNLREGIGRLLQNQALPAAWDWLAGTAQSLNGSSSRLPQTFALVPRKTGKQIINSTPSQQQELAALRPGLSIHHWPVDRLSRVWLLLHLHTDNKEQYIQTIEALFRTGEMNELVALYSALPLLAWPEDWAARCSEGIRSNISMVLETIMCDNPYPSEQLTDAAWNQLVLKAFFTEKPIHRIIGLEARANRELAFILRDYAHERWAAQRPVHPQLWRCVGKFIDDSLFPDIEKIAAADNPFERKAAALACADSSYAPARELLQQTVAFRQWVYEDELTWNSLAMKMENWH